MEVRGDLVAEADPGESGQKSRTEQRAGRGTSSRVTRTAAGIRRSWGTRLRGRSVQDRVRFGVQRVSAPCVCGGRASALEDPQGHPELFPGEGACGSQGAPHTVRTSWDSHAGDCRYPVKTTRWEGTDDHGSEGCC